MTRIKICGLTNATDALAAVRAGADALGFVFAPSPRQISPETAREIIQSLPPFVTTVGVFVDHPAEEVEEIVRECGLDLVQLHGRETPAFCARFQGRAVKVLPMDQGIDMDTIAAFRPVTRALLLDSGKGGTGKTFDWQSLPDALDRDRMILAGGLTLDNVGTAIKTLKPWAVDVASGVESAPGRKDIRKMKAFIEQVREADHDLG
jgi:phosphoribosylanthranilate isomerase